MNSSSLPPQEQRQRVVRVFVSSTFRDMQDERDELVLKIFPELRKRCRERQVEFVEVDLRWGITEEQSQRGEVLPICLAEIERCRPYFICILGERYGWVPDMIDPELIQTQEWLEEHREKSVTELEILHGVLRNPSMAGRSYFYFRDPAYLEQVPEDRRPDFLSEDPKSREKLENLKQRIRRSGLPLKDKYPNPTALGQLILDDLWEAIDREFPEKEIPEPLDREAMEHEAFAQSRAKVYIGREEYFKRLDDHVAGDDPPLVLVGESGVGKSALIACWAERYRKSHPEDLVILHFIGSNPGSTDYRAIIRRIMGEIKRRYKVDQEIPSTPDKLREAFPLWLSIVASRSAYNKEQSVIATGILKRIRNLFVGQSLTVNEKRLILILDGLNQIEDVDNARHLVWLPGYFPPKVRVIVSSLPGLSLDALQKRNWPQFEVHGLRPEERRALVEEYLGLYRKTLSRSQLELVASATQTSNPLYLRALLEELRIFGIHEELDSRIIHYLQAKTVPDLYEMILKRLEKDYEKEDEDLVGDSMSFIWASRRGLYESELLGLLADSNQPVPRAIWSPLYLAIEESLVSRSGLLNFSHDYLKQAVEHRYLSTDNSRRDRHIKVANFFETRDLDDRKADELPWQLEKAKDWKRLKDCLTDMAMYSKLIDDTKHYELMGYWLKLERQGLDLVKSYQSSIAGYEESRPSAEELSSSLYKLGIFFELNARYAEAEPMYRRALEIVEQLPESHQTAAAIILNDLAWLLRTKGDYVEAVRLCERAIEIYEQVIGPKGPDMLRCFSNLAGLIHRSGDYDRAEPVYRKVLEIQEQDLGPTRPDTCNSLNSLADLLKDKGNYAEAEQLYRRALEIREQVLGPTNPNTGNSLNSLAELLKTKGDYAGAEPLFRRALEINEQVLGPTHPDTGNNLNSLAELLRTKGDYAGAEPLFRRALEIQEQVLGPTHPNTASMLNNLAELLRTKGDYAGAKPLYRRALEIQEQVLGPMHPDTAPMLNNLAELLNDMGDYAGAEPLFRRALEIYEQVLGPTHPNTAQIINNLAALLNDMGDYAGAEPLFRRALEIREQALGPTHASTAQSLNNLAGLLSAKGDYAGAEPFFRRALEIYEQVLGPKHPDTAAGLNNLAVLLQGKGDYAGAEPLFRRALEIREQALGPTHANTAQSLNNLAELLSVKGDYAGAEPLYRRVLEIYEQVLGPNNSDTAKSLNNLAELLKAKGDYKGAFPLYLRALKTNEKVLGPEHSDTAASLSNLANLLHAQGDYDGATSLHQRALTIREGVLGLDHPATASSLNNLAVVLMAKGDLDGAEPLFRRALKTRERVLGQDHPDTATSLNSLASLLYNRGDYAGAQPLWQRVVEIRKKALGEDHIATATALNNLAALFCAKGDYDLAGPLFRRALEIQKKVLGLDHPSTIITLNNLASIGAKSE